MTTNVGSSASYGIKFAYPDTLTTTPKPETHTNLWERYWSYPLFGKIDKVILKGERTIVFFSFGYEKRKVVLKNTSDTRLNFFDRVFLAVLKQASNSKQWTFFSTYTDMPCHEPDQKKYLKDYAEAIGGHSFYDYWMKQLKHIFFEIPYKEKLKIVIVQEPAEEPKPKKRRRYKDGYK